MENRVAPRSDTTRRAGRAGSEAVLGRTGGAVGISRASTAARQTSSATERPRFAHLANAEPPRIRQEAAPDRTGNVAGLDTPKEVAAFILSAGKGEPKSVQMPPKHQGFATAREAADFIAKAGTR
jgi:hypothetical protein